MSATFRTKLITGLEVASLVAMVGAGIGLLGVDTPTLAAKGPEQQLAIDLHYYPNRATAVIADWSERAINDCMSMTGATLDADVQRCVESYFDSTGYAGLAKAMRSTNIVSLLEENQPTQPASASYVTRGPSLVNRYYDDANLYWHFQASVRVSHYFVLAEQQQTTGATVDYVVQLGRATDNRQNGLTFTRFHIET